MSKTTLSAVRDVETAQSRLLDIHEVAARTGRSADRIRKLRTNAEIAKHGPHPLYSKGFKVGFGDNSPLQWRECDVEAFLDDRRRTALGGAA